MSLADLSGREPKVRNILFDGHIGHAEAIERILDLDAEWKFSESAVRRWRKRNGVKLLMKPLPEALPEAVADADDAEYLRAELVRVGKLLDKEKDKQSAYVNAVYAAVADGIKAYDYDGFAIVSAPPTIPGTGTEEVAVALLSDLQLAKVSRKGEQVLYDSAIAEKRVMTYANKIVEITNVQRAAHPVKKIVVPVLGDMIEGEEIFPGQMWQIDSGLYRQITVNGPRIIRNFIKTLAATFDEVEVVWVIGNHGRIGGTSARNHDPETNGDRMLGQICKMLLEDDEKVTFRVIDGPGESNWFDFVEIGNYRALCIHGNQVPGSAGLPFNGIVKKVNSWAAGAIEEPFDDVYMGHYHTRAVIPVNKRNVYVNGSTESYNTYAQEVVGALSEPSQWLLFVHPERGRVTASYGVELT